MRLQIPLSLLSPIKPTGSPPYYQTRSWYLFDVGEFLATFLFHAQRIKPVHTTQTRSTSDTPADGCQLDFLMKEVHMGDLLLQKMTGTRFFLRPRMWTVTTVLSKHLLQRFTFSPHKELLQRLCCNTSFSFEHTTKNVNCYNGPHKELLQRLCCIIFIFPEINKECELLQRFCQNICYNGLLTFSPYKELLQKLCCNTYLCTYQYLQFHPATGCFAQINEQ
jgi:hypothetical protein